MFQWYLFILEYTSYLLHGYLFIILLSSDGVQAHDSFFLYKGAIWLAHHMLRKTLGTWRTFLTIMMGPHWEHTKKPSRDIVSTFVLEYIRNWFLLQGCLLNFLLNNDGGGPIDFYFFQKEPFDWPITSWATHWELGELC